MTVNDLLRRTVQSTILLAAAGAAASAGIAPAPAVPLVDGAARTIADFGLGGVADGAGIDLTDAPRIAGDPMAHTDFPIDANGITPDGFWREVPRRGGDEDPLWDNHWPPRDSDSDDQSNLPPAVLPPVDPTPERTSGPDALWPSRNGLSIDASDPVVPTPGPVVPSPGGILLLGLAGLASIRRR